MKRQYLVLFAVIMFFSFCNASGQDSPTSLKQNAIQIRNVDSLSDPIYRLLAPYQIIMIGETHGTKEPSRFVIGLAELLSIKGDSVQVGLEIPSTQLTKYLSSHTDSSLYLSDFFANPSFESGRESFAWAEIISSLKNNPNVNLFFYDVNDGESNNTRNRDSLMYIKIKKQFIEHPSWKMITISGNMHNMTSPEREIGRQTMASYLKRDNELKVSDKICSIKHFYSSGTALTNHGQGLEKRNVGNPPSVYSMTTDFDTYLVLVSDQTSYAYNGIYYTKQVTASQLVKNNLDIPSIKKQLSVIYDRDQKTRTGSDSSNYANYIDSSNLVQVEQLVSKYGWMGISLVGARGNVAQFLVIQHANIETQLKYFPLLQRSVAEGESRVSDMALMQDRILMRQEKKQIYGTQVVFDKTGAPVFWQIEDEKNVNIRRAKVGLEPLENYAKNFGINYSLPKE